MPTIISGMLRVISKNGGIKLDSSDKWINMAKGLKGFNQADYEKYRNKQVDVTVENGYWVYITGYEHTTPQPKQTVNSPRFGMLFNRAHEEALFRMGLKYQQDKQGFVDIFKRLQEYCEACEVEYHDKQN